MTIKEAGCTLEWSGLFLIYRNTSTPCINNKKYTELSQRLRTQASRDNDSALNAKKISARKERQTLHNRDEQKK